MSFQDAQTACRKWYGQLAQVDAGEVAPGRYTVAMACEAYLEDRRVRLRNDKDTSDEAKIKLKKKLMQDRATINAYILPELGNIEIGKLTHARMKNWRDGRVKSFKRLRSKKGQPQAYSDQQVSKATVNKNLAVFKAALNYAKTETRAIVSDAAWVDVKPFKGADKPKIRFLTNDEVTAVVANCEPDFQSLVKGALLTGCRYGELTAMTVEDFNSKDGQVFVATSKNGESRYVDLNDAGIEFFSELTKGRKPKDILFERSNGNAWKTSEQFRPMNAACEEAKVEGVTFHILRHTYASHSLMAGMTIEVLAQQLGHKDTRITMRHYAHLCPTFKQESVRQNAPSFGFNVNPGPLLVSKAG